MVRSMYSGVAGLKAHQSKMDVIGNNIANVNTWGYKTMDTSFKESIYQTLVGGSSGSTNDGGYGATNPSMVGYGTMVSAITANFTTGTKVTTGRGMDCFIEGTAFFAVGPMYGEGDAKSPKDISLSRVGDFGFRNGYLVDSNGRYVYGCNMTTGGITYKPPGKSENVKTEDVRIPLPTDDLKKWDAATGLGSKTEYDYHATDNTKMEVTTTVGIAKTLADLGITAGSKTPAEIAAEVAGKSDPTKGITYTYDTTSGAVTETTVSKKDKTLPLPSSTTVKDPTTGIVTITSYIDNGKKNGTATLSVTTKEPDDPDAEYTGPVFEDGRMIFDPEKGSYSMADSVTDLKPLKFPTSCTYYDEAGNLQTEENIEFSNVTIDGTGMIYGTSTASNRTYIVGNIALVNVPNPSGMGKGDGPYYNIGGSSGEGSIVQSGSDVGTISSGALESANVDIANEFATMITTQRGFQANSKIITVTDEMLQELVNMKR